MKTLLTASGIAVALAFLVYVGVVPTLTAQGTNTVITDEPDVVLHIKGLACANCARTMKSALLEIEGIEDAEVFLEDDQRVHVQLLEGISVDEETLQKAVEDCGFVLERVEYKNRTSADG